MTRSKNSAVAPSTGASLYRVESTRGDLSRRYCIVYTYRKMAVTRFSSSSLRYRAVSALDSVEVSRPRSTIPRKFVAPTVCRCLLSIYRWVVTKPEATQFCKYFFIVFIVLFDAIISMLYHLHHNNNNNTNNTQLVTHHMSVNAYSYIYERTESQARTGGLSVTVGFMTSLTT